jgi:hypothetical protein
MKVGHASERIGLVRDGAGKIRQVLAVTTDLYDWMQLWRTRHARNLDEFRVAFKRERGGPLLQLDDYIRRLSRQGVDSGQDYVSSLRCEWEVVLHKHLDFAETGINEISRKCRKALPPRRLFGWRRASTGLVQHLLQQLLDERLGFLATNAIGGRPDKRQVGSPAQHETSRAGGDISGS